jgi:hypothetical protein
MTSLRLFLVWLVSIAPVANSTKSRPRHPSISRSLLSASARYPNQEYIYLGCFADGNPRILSSFQSRRIMNDPKSCVDLCATQGMPLAGVQYGFQCFCGESLVISEDAGRQVEDKRCNMKCSGNPFLTCGGSWTMQVYKRKDNEDMEKRMPLLTGDAAPSTKLVVA